MSQAGTIGPAGGGAGLVNSVTGTPNQILAAPTTGAVVLSLIGPYTPATYTSHGVLLGNTTSSITATAAGTTGQVLTGVTGSAPTFQSPAASSISITGDSGGPLTGAAFTFTGGSTGLTFAGAGSTETLGGDLVVANGGTGNTSFTAYSVITAGTTPTGAFTNVVGVGTSGQVLTSNGAAALPTWQAAAATGITTIDGDTGSITGTTVSLKGASTAGSSVKFTGSGTAMTFAVTDALDNTILGAAAGNTSISGAENTGVGDGVFAALTSGASNTAIGYQTLTDLLSGASNTAIGLQALSVLTTGQENIALGSGAGFAYTTSESSNIVIGNAGVITESNVIRIGTQGSSPGQQNECFIAGITSVNISNQSFVQINTSTGQLGVTTAGAASLFTSINVQTFTSSGTYTPTAGMLYCTIECVGGGGGGGGTGNSGATASATGGGGGGGAYSRKFASAATIGASQTVTIPNAAAGGTAGNNAGASQTATSVGSICTANGGSGGGGNSGSGGASGGAGGTAGTGDFSVPGQSGGNTISAAITTVIIPYGGGGASCLGFGGTALISASDTTGNAGQLYGGGGGGGSSFSAAGAAAGGAGGKGIVIITEYI